MSRPGAALMLVAAALGVGCGGKSGESSEPTSAVACEPAATAAAQAAADSMLDGPLDGYSDELIAATRADMAENLTAACTDTAWSAEVRACMAAVTSVETLRECTGGFEAPQTEAYGDALMSALNAAEAAHGGGAPDAGAPDAGEPSGG